MFKKASIAVLFFCLVMAHQYSHTAPNPTPVSVPVAAVQVYQPLAVISSQTNIPAAAPFSHNLEHALTIGQSYESSRDLHSFYLQYRNSPNPDEQAFAWKALDLCAMFITSTPDEPLNLMPQRLPDRSSDQESANLDLYARCKSFGSAFNTSRQFLDEMERLHSAIMQSDSYVLIGEQISAFDNIGQNDEIKSLLKKVLLSKEPEAILSVVDDMQLVWEDSASDDTPSTPATPVVVNAMALTLATCDLGRNCAVDANTSLKLCYLGGVCHGSTEEALTGLTLAQQQAVLNKKDDYVNALQHGNTQALGLN